MSVAGKGESGSVEPGACKKPWAQPTTTTYSASNAQSVGRVTASDGVNTCHS